MLRLTLFTLLLLSALNGWAQTAVISGMVSDSNSFRAIEGAYITLRDTNLHTYTDERGRYKLIVPANRPLYVQFSYIGKYVMVRVEPLPAGSEKRIDARLSSEITTGEANVQGFKNREVPSIITIDPKDAAKFPNPSGNFESILKTLGVASGNNELSSGFNVRGGNYDENLIYVNDIEIYRPQLIRSGQQEGLSFINPDLVENISFSAGGFQARYGDKLSSVLDIKYKQPRKRESGFQASLLGAQAYTQGRIGPRFSYLLGARYRSNSYLFGTFDVQGNYKPRFGDFQSLLTYRVTTNFDISLLSSFAANRFLFIPESQRTSFGTVTQALQLSVFFNGAELMRYRTLTNGLTFNYNSSPRAQSKLILSHYTSTETEFYTVEGAYRLDELDKDLGSETFGQAKFNRGAGYFINHARNELLVNSYSASFKNTYTKGRWFIHWGADYRREEIRDVLNEWVYNDSVDYSVPFNEGDSLFLYSRIRSKNNLRSNRISGYVQQTWNLNDSLQMKLNVGIRSHYWDLNGQNVISPRVQFSFEPNYRYNRQKGLPDSLKKKDLVLKAAWGIYYQPPFYRELRALDGQVNRNLKAQRSIHFVLGSDFYFDMWGRKFKFFGELYYKHLDNLVPYLYENVRIRYYANNNARGYATGIDTRVNGEFVKGLESWFSFSLLQTKERIRYTDENGVSRETGWLRRPTDQRINIGIFFQDELPKYPSFKVHLNVVIGSGLPYFLTGAARYQDDYKIPAYRRVDIGFTKEIISETRVAKKAWLKPVNSLWLTADIFNLLGVSNTVSYLWVRDVTGTVYAVPNYLTTRRLNLNLIVKF